jgi:hypothetical protein
MLSIKQINNKTYITADIKNPLQRDCSCFTITVKPQFIVFVGSLEKEQWI